MDLLSDISGDRIVFSRVTSERTAIFVFDVATSALTEINPTPGSKRLSSAIGANTVAYVDFGTSATGDIFVADLNAPATAVLVSGSPSMEGNLNVSPDGNVVVWELCPTTQLSCDVYKAVKTAGVWGAPAAVANTTSPEGNPDTDGTHIVYDADLPGSATGKDIYVVPIAGGTAVQLEIAGLQNNPSISGGVVAFESIAPGFTKSDVFVYVIATNTMHQVTSTATDHESLTDVSVLPTGEVRVVWAADDGLGGDLNIYAHTFTVPLGNVVDTIPELVALVESLNLQQGISNSLDAKLENAQKALDRAKAGDTGSACYLMDAFINEVNAQEGHELTEAQADSLRDAAGAIKTALGCA